MSFDPKRYPVDWHDFSHHIRFTVAGGQCMCMGECGLHRNHPGARRCTERHGEPAKWAKGKVVLTVAHLNADDGICRCDPVCDIPEHVKAMCNRCHLRYDHKRHMGKQARSRRARRNTNELFGQMEPPPGP